MTTPIPRDQFPVTEHYRYFDHAGVSPLPRVAADAARWWADWMLAKGKVDYDVLEARQEDTRAVAASVMGVPVDDVAFIKNTTEGLAFVAGGLDWSPGDRVVVPDREFPSTIYPWLALEDRGVRVDRVAPSGPSGALPLEEFARVIADGPPPKIVATSWVQYTTGWRTDLAALADLAHAAGALLCVDVIQALGVFPAALEAWDVDFAMADGHKWLLSGEGLGIMYIAARVRDRVRPLEPGWSSVAHRWDYENLSVVWDGSARRFEGGTANMVGTAVLDASLRMLEEADIAAIWRHVDGLCDHLVSQLTHLDGVRVLSDRSPEGRSSIVTFTVEGIGSEDLRDRLTARGFVCAPRAGGVRIAPHGYNTVEEIDALVAETASQRRR